MSGHDKTFVSRRSLLQAGAGFAGILATGRAPAFAQAQPKKLDFANILGAPDVGGIAMELFAKEITARGKGEVEVRFHGGTLLAKEMEIMNAVKAGNVAIGSTILAPRIHFAQWACAVAKALPRHAPLRASRYRRYVSHSRLQREVAPIRGEQVALERSAISCRIKWLARCRPAVTCMARMLLNG